MTQKGVSKKPEKKAQSTGLFHVIDPQAFQRPLLDELCDLATRVRAAAKHAEGARFLQGLSLIHI